MKNDFVKELNRFGGLEFASFRLKEGVSEQDLFKAVDEMVEGLYLREECFLGHCLLKGEDNIYVEMVFATDKESAKYLCQKWGQNNNFAKECLSYLNVMDIESTQINFYKRVK